MADGLDLVRWGQLEHNYGSADDVPGLLRRMREPDADVALGAAEELFNLLYYQGGWICSAASPALPCLLDIARDPTARCRRTPLELVASLAGTALEVAEWFDAAWTAEWTAAWASVLALLADDDPEVRRSATYLVGVGATAVEEAVGALTGRWPVESDVTGRLDIIMAVGECVGRGADAAWLRPLVNYRDPQCG